MANQQSKNRAVWKWVLGVVGVLIAVLIGAYFFIKKDLSNPKTSKLKPLITDQFKKMITGATDSLYQIKYTTFDFNLDSGKALITDFELVPDTAVFRRLVAQRRAPDNLIYMKVARITMDKFGFVKVDSGLKFNVSRMSLISPNITVYNKRRPNHSGYTALHDKALFKLMQKVFKHMNTDVMAVRNMKFVLVNQNRAAELRTTMRMNLDASGFTTETIDAKGLVLKVKTFRYSTPDSLYRIIVKNMRFAQRERRITAQHFSVWPRLSKPAFYRTVKYAKDRYHFEYDGVAMNNIDLDALMRKQQFRMGSIVMDRVWVEVYKNYNWPFRNVPPRRNAYPNEKLQKLAFDVTIDTVRVKSGEILHTIFPKGSRKTATLLLSNMNGHYYNVTNIPEDLRRNHYAIVNTTNRMMGAGLLHTKYVFDLTATDGAYTYAATMGPMDARALNPLTGPLAMMEAKAGTINKMEAFIKANEYRATGYVNLYYKGMKINLLKRDEDADTLKKRPILSFLTNMFTPNDNPTKSGKFRKGPVNITRDAHESFLGFLWRGMLDGSSSAMMGLNQKKKKPEKNIITKIGRVFMGPKQEKVNKGRQKRISNLFEINFNNTKFLMLYT